jgi:arginine N-succinyltransferase
MVLVRPVTLSDLPQLLALAEQAGVGLTTLPKDPEILRRRILKSERSMESVPDRPGGEAYLFVMEDADAGRVIGASGIISKVGGYEPFYAYNLETILHESKDLGVHKEVQVLQLSREHNGPAEVGSLFLSPDYRKKDYGRFLQLVRFLFLAEHREAFEQVVVSELRGVIDESGRSAFWEAVGKHFFEIDFPKADHLSVVNKKFIADLMPTIPLYVPLLPLEAQRVIGQVHNSSKPAMKNLEAEGFRFANSVDIFDAGPCVSCRRDDIRTVKQSRTAALGAELPDSVDTPTYMICSSGAAGTSAPGGAFRATIGSLLVTSDGRASVSRATAGALGTKAGDRVRYVLLRPDKTSAD